MLRYFQTDSQKKQGEKYKMELQKQVIIFFFK